MGGSQWICDQALALALRGGSGVVNIQRDLSPSVMLGVGCGGLWQKGCGSKWMFSSELAFPSLAMGSRNVCLVLWCE